jgi:hypothetical protein
MAPNVMAHIGSIIARISPDIARHYTRAPRHELRCPYWNRAEPTDCTCSCRPVIDLLLHIIARKTT